MGAFNSTSPERPFDSEEAKKEYKKKWYSPYGYSMTTSDKKRKESASSEEDGDKFKAAVEKANAAARLSEK